MQSGDSNRREETRANFKTIVTPPASSQSRWRVPPSVQRLFDKFPLRVYPANDLPRHSPRNRNQDILYIFTTEAEAALEAPSFNPGCLKWQAYLTFNRVAFKTVSSCNHASPSGSLPFLLPASATSLSSSTALYPVVDPIPTSKLESWAQSQRTSPQPGGHSDPSLAPYSTLLSHPIRLAYLYALYLHPATFISTAAPLYIAPSSRSTLVRLSLEHPLRAAALSELLATSSGPVPRIDAERLLQEADAAFAALSTLLDDAPWFGSRRATSPPPGSKAASTTTTTTTTGRASSSAFDELDEENQQRTSGFGLFDEGDGDGDDDSGSNGTAGQQRRQQQEVQPGMLDAALFAYTQVILLLFVEQDEASPARRLYESVRRRRNLVDHRERVLRRFFSTYYESRG